MKIIKLILIFFVRVYQYTLGAILPPACRFTPTCSQYAIEAISKHGPFKGCWLTAKRILRCNPFCKAGYDPVPDK